MALINHVMLDKDRKTRVSMDMMGLKSISYWLSWLLFHSTLAAINGLVTIALGYIFKFDLIRNTDFIVIFVTLFAFNLAMINLGYLITTFCLKIKTALLCGIGVFIVGLIFTSIIFSETYLAYLWWSKITPSIIKYLFYAIPFFHFGKITTDIKQLAQGPLDPVTEMIVAGPGFRMKDLFIPLPEVYIPNYGDSPYIPPTIESLNFDRYFDRVFPDAIGNRKGPLFFLNPAYYGFHAFTHSRAMRQLKNSQKIKIPYNEDVDVEKERDEAFDLRKLFAIRITNLKKVYSSGIFSSVKSKLAVNHVCLTLENGKLLALLGQNGAGKSTLQNILAGAVRLTDGDAFIFGFSVRFEMHKIREIMGVCPQFDILFEDLTPWEHVELYAGIKNLSLSKVRKTMKERISMVKLDKVVNAHVKTFSGGMKRRLSLILSTLGDPHVVYMDEPTTGMDPLNRRHVWTFIEEFKKDRAVILTTHSMEEADVLGDKIAIMAHGRIRALGSSINLKARFGSGYRISLVISPKNSNKVKDQVSARMREAKLEDETAGSLIYNISPNEVPYIPKFVDYLETNPDGLIKAWGISHSTLEDVFLRIIREANPHGYAGYEVQK
ncbi:P-loop containing nucleoside triphosphate hydrolase domain-containing protein [Rozella allomycis CSF55]|uniref:p-loop containing nucleoside triphosphate hydrolase domain-containing protein n=1 Tax=Rozella allomycis (strain CSF55) TaxID=988480 RepID=A0A075B591_ROZAC|nr:P-loop containing nucleoside triphosphate hydrolase domain-containing protein [Rozella allomycis CSF55]|eukprot:EPZ36999.1 P-loop containing nucleoside triphosphate hydrolase domain-containing protein [Rozella allomycis CSF55]